jgi:hypothetical protein
MLLLDNEPDYGRELILILSGVLVALVFIFGFELMRRYSQADKEKRRSDSYTLFFIMACCLIGYSVYNIVAIIDYSYTSQGYALDYFDREIYNGLLRWLSMFLILPMAVISEHLLWPNKFKIKIGKLKIGIMMILGILMTFYMWLWVVLNKNSGVPGPTSRNPIFFVPLVISYILFSLTGFFGFLSIIFKQMAPQKRERNQILLALIFAIVALIGAILTGVNRADNDLEHNQIQILGAVLEIIGWGFSRHFILEVKDYSEIQWRDGIISMLIFTHGGISLYDRVFNKKDTDELFEKGSIPAYMLDKNNKVLEKPNTDLIASGIVGIRSMLGEITQQSNSDLKVVKIGRRSLISSQGKYIYTMILTKENLGVYHYLMRKLAWRVEKANDDLEHFSGDLNSLTLEPIVNGIFGKEEESK